MSPKVCQSPMAVLQIPQVPLGTIHRTVKCSQMSVKVPQITQRSVKCLSKTTKWSPLITSSPWTRPPKVQSNVLLSMLRSPWLPEYQKVCQSTLKSIRCPTKSLSHSSKFYQKCLKDSKSLKIFTGAQPQSELSCPKVPEGSSKYLRCPK